MKNLLLYGRAPYSVAVIHGGPGAGGEMAPVARELASARGVLEPIQTAETLEGQVEELRTLLDTYGRPPCILIGFSWGAWLGFIVAAHYPALVQKLLLVGSGPFEEKYVELLHNTRLERFGKEERTEFQTIMRSLNSPVTENQDALLRRFGALAAKSDTYEAMENVIDDRDSTGPKASVFRKVWDSAAALRRSGELLQLGKNIQCPVVAIHGDYDPHPAEGVQKPLSTVLKEFRLVLLDRCGHRPWIERYAQARFYKELKEELSISAVQQQRS